jgi:radical SAM-linked protein
VQPRLASEKPGFSGKISEKGAAEDESIIENRLRMRYSKIGSAKYFGHLELTSIFLRAFRRASIEMKYTQGFHPKPKISFHDAIPVGVESQCEEFYLTAAGPIDCKKAASVINQELPEGLVIIDCQTVPAKSGPGQQTIRIYHVTREDGGFDTACLEAFKRADVFPVRHRAKKNREREIDLRQVIREIHLEAPNRLTLCLNNMPGQTIRPGKALQAIFGMPQEAATRLRIVKVPAEA